MLEPGETSRLLNLCGPLNQNLQQIERALNVKISNRGNHFSIAGSLHEEAANIIHHLYRSTKDKELTPDDVHICIHACAYQEQAGDEPAPHKPEKTIRIGKVFAHGKNQAAYLKSMANYDLSFGVGPAGTGKTYLAVAVAVDALQRNRVKRLVLVRPAVEAGERLGFLPGDLAQKVDPYLRPIYDALYSMLGVERVNKMIERGEIDVAPLAYMRGCSLNNAFIILDEAQNTTVQQMKMFLTRIGFDSKAVVSGDITQIDLPSNQKSGLRDALHVLRDVPGIGFTFFDSGDVVRHRLVKDIVAAYRQQDEEDESNGSTDC